MKPMLLFDLDGTLWDSAEPVADSWNQIFVKYDPSLPPVTAEDVHSVMGLTMTDIARRIQPTLSPALREQAFQECFAYEVAYLRDHCGTLYPRLRETLEALRAAGYPLAIVSNCQAGYIDSFLSSSGLGDCFQDWEEWGRTGRPKGENIRLVLERNGYDRGIYIGDTRTDQEAARQAGIPFIHAAYGFGQAVQPEGSIPSIDALPAALEALAS